MKCLTHSSSYIWVQPPNFDPTRTDRFFFIPVPAMECARPRILFFFDVILVWSMVVWVTCIDCLIFLDLFYKKF